MADRAYETPQHFLKYVVQPNETTFGKQSDSLNAAFNAIMSTDALAGHIFLALRVAGATDAKDDSAFRAELAGKNDSFRLIRDTAKALKHIELDRYSPMIKRADQTVVKNRPYGSGLYGVGKFGGEEVMIELTDGDVKHCLSEVISSNAFLITLIKEIAE